MATPFVTITLSEDPFNVSYLQKTDTFETGQWEDSLIHVLVGGSGSNFCAGFIYTEIFCVTLSLY